MAITDQVFHTVLRIHESLYKSTDGRVGHKLLGVPTLLLRTTGRRSGQTRTNALVYAPDGDRWLVVPSNGGADKPPGWLHNLRETPSVEVQIGREKIPATATIVEPGDPDFPRLWKAVNENNGDRYDGYQAKTKRAIPVVALAAS